MPNKDIDLDLLSTLLRRKRKRAELSLRELAGQIGISAPTLQRIESGQRPAAKALMRIADWLGVSVDDFRPKRKAIKNETETVEKIEVFLRADRNLNSEAASAISDIVRKVYDSFVSGKIKK